MEESVGGCWHKILDILGVKGLLPSYMSKVPLTIKTDDATGNPRDLGPQQS